ncbi:Myb-like_DNA-binding domain-containing protein [Hexamita inflata]|uniref:Myb-like DNA-binding domain-containing protein n=1 Tax=Hexamita inflata TaxID=28002 RepID=A0AA86RZ42_9EUKA|nr:Myb-like DNA-binding domain-containing protein [Hexamita inflata]
MIQNINIKSMIEQLKLLCGEQSTIINSSNESNVLQEETRRGTRDSRCRWSKEEHERFLDGVDQFGRKQHRDITNLVRTRSNDQTVSHSQKMYTVMDKIFNSFIDGDDFHHKYSSSYTESNIKACMQLANQSYNIIEPFNSICFDGTLQQCTVINNQLRIPYVSYQYCKITPKLVQKMFGALYKYAPRKAIITAYLSEKLLMDKSVIELCLLV